MRLVAIAGSVLVAAGCAAAPPAGPREVATAAEPAPFAELTSAFEKANPGWKVLPTVQPAHRRDAVIAARRETRGARKAATPAEAEASARAWLTRNASFFGLPRDQVASLAGQVVSYPKSLAEPEAHPYVVVLRRALVRAGPEAITTVVPPLRITLTILDDGEPHVVTTDANRPDLRFRTTPGLAAADASAAVIGRPLYGYGPVSKDDIREVELSIVIDWAPQLEAWLAYAVHVVKGEVRAVFLVDADTGRVERDPPPRGPLPP